MASMSGSIRASNRVIVIALGVAWSLCSSKVPLLAQHATDQGQSEPNLEQGAALPGGAIARLGTPRAVITGRIKAIAPSPDGRWLAVVNENRASGQAHIALLDAKTLALARTIAPVNDGPPLLQFSPDSKILHTRKSSWPVDPEKPAERPVAGDLLGISPNGKHWLVNRRQDLKLVVWDAVKQKEVGTLQSPPGAPMTRAAVTDDGKYVLRIERFRLRIDDVVNQTAVEPSQRAIATEILAVPGADRFLAAGAGGAGAILIDATNGKTIRQFEAKHSLSHVAVSGDGRQFAAAIPHQSVQVWEVATGEIIQELPTPGYEIHALAYSADNKTLFASAERGVADSRLFAWDTKEWQERPPENDPKGPYRRLVFSPDGRWLAAGSVLGKIDLWDVAEKRIARTIVADASFDLRFSRDGWLIGAAGPQHRYGIWEVESAEQLFSVPVNFPQYSNSVASFSPDLDWLAVDRGGRLSRIKTTTGQVEEVTTNQDEQIEGQVFSLSYSADGNVLLCTSGSNPSADIAPIAQIDVASGAVSHPFEADRNLPAPHRPQPRGRNLYRAEWSPDGATFAATDERRVINLWDVRSGDYWDTLQSGDIRPAFSPDGNYLAGFGRKTLTLFEVHTGQVVFSRIVGAPPTGRDGAQTSRTLADGLPDNGLTAVAISPDGRHLAGAFRDDDTILLWNLIPLGEQEIAEIKADKSNNYEEWWAALNGDNASAAYAATWRFALGGERAMAFLKQRVAQSTENADDSARIESLINDLDRALKNNVNAEMRQAIALLNANKDRARSYLTTDQLARLRAIVALERSGSAAATEVLKIMAAGAEHLRDTWFARSALERLSTPNVP